MPIVVEKVGAAAPTADLAAVWLWYREKRLERWKLDCIRSPDRLHTIRATVATAARSLGNLKNYFSLNRAVGIGCTVYVTGRSEMPGDASLPGTIHETAEAVTAAGGEGIAVRVDHGEDEQIRALFERVRRDQGRLDILVNNVCALRSCSNSGAGWWCSRRCCPCW
jgi:hypothetical protein